jgi:hypothetical protein
MLTPAHYRARTTRRRKKAPKRVLAVPDLEQSKAAVLNSLTSASGQRTYVHAIRRKQNVVDKDTDRSVLSPR